MNYIKIFILRIFNLCINFITTALILYWYTFNELGVYVQSFLILRICQYLCCFGNNLIFTRRFGDNKYIYNNIYILYSQQIFAYGTIKILLLTFIYYLIAQNMLSAFLISVITLFSINFYNITRKQVYILKTFYNIYWRERHKIRLSIGFVSCLYSSKV